MSFADVLMIVLIMILIIGLIKLFEQKKKK